jgi:hypothetical protein
MMKRITICNVHMMTLLLVFLRKTAREREQRNQTKPPRVLEILKSQYISPVDHVL